MNNFGRSIEEIQKMIDTIGQKLDITLVVDEKSEMENDLLELEIALSSGDMPEDKWGEVSDWLRGSDESLLLEYAK